jgi:hypothetical protein
MDETGGLGKRPVVMDILAPDLETSLLPDDLKLVLHVNPRSMKFSYSKIIERIQTKGGYVEQHFGDGTESISMEAVTGGFMRLFTGLVSITGNGLNLGGTRRDTVAYDVYLDMLALFHNNGAIYDSRGQIIFHGIIKLHFDGMDWLGWFNSFSVSEEAERPYQFSLSADFTIAQEFMSFRSVVSHPIDTFSSHPQQPLQNQLDELQANTAAVEAAAAVDADSSSSGWLRDGLDLVLGG